MSATELSGHVRSIAEKLQKRAEDTAKRNGPEAASGLLLSVDQLLQSADLLEKQQQQLNMTSSGYVIRDGTPTILRNLQLVGAMLDKKSEEMKNKQAMGPAKSLAMSASHVRLGVERLEFTQSWIEQQLGDAYSNDMDWTVAFEQISKKSESCSTISDTAGQTSEQSAKIAALENDLSLWKEHHESTQSQHMELMAQWEKKEAEMIASYAKLREEIDNESQSHIEALTLARSDLENETQNRMKLEHELENLKVECAKAEQDMQEEWERVVNQSKGLNTRVEEMQLKVDSQQVVNASLTEQIVQHQDTIAKLNTDLEVSLNELNTLRADNESAKNELESGADAEISSLKNQLSQQQSEASTTISDLEMRLKDCEVKCGQAEYQLKNLKIELEDEIAALQSRIAQQSVDASNDISTINEKLQHAEHELKLAQDLLEKERHEFEQQLASANTSVRDTENCPKEDYQEEENVHRKIETLAESVRALHDEKIQLQSEIDRLEAAVEHEQSTVTIHVDKVRALEAHVDKADQLHSEMRASHEEATMATQERVTKLKDELRATTKRFADRESNLIEEVQTLTNQVEVLETLVKQPQTCPELDAALEEVVQLKIKLCDLEDIHSKLENERNALIDSQRELIQRCSNLQETLQSQESGVENLQQELTTSRNSIETSNEKIQALVDELAKEKSEHLAQLKQTELTLIESFEAEKSELESQIHIMEEEYGIKTQELQRQITDASHETELVHMKLQSTIDSLSCELDASRENVTKLSESLRSAEADAHSHREALSAHETSQLDVINELQQEKETTTRMLQSLQEKLDALNTTHAIELQEKADEISELNRVISQLQLNVATLEAAAEQVAESPIERNVVDEVTMLKNTISEKEREFILLQQQVHASEKQLEQSRTAIAELESQLDHATSKTHQELANVMQSLHQVEEEKQKAIDALHEVQSKSNDEALTKELETLRAEQHKIASDLEASENSISQLLVKLEDAKLKVLTTEEEKETIQNQLSQLEEQLQAVHSSEMHHFAEKMRELSCENEKLQANEIHHTEKLDNMTKKIESLMIKINSLTSEKAHCQSQLESLEKAAHSQSNELQEAHKSVVLLQESLESTKQAFVDETNELKHQIERLESEKQDLVRDKDAILEEWQIKVSDVESAYTKKTEELDAKLRDVEFKLNAATPSSEVESTTKSLIAERDAVQKKLNQLETTFESYKTRAAAALKKAEKRSSLLNPMLEEKQHLEAKVASWSANCQAIAEQHENRYAAQEDIISRLNAKLYEQEAASSAIIQETEEKKRMEEDLLVKLTDFETKILELQQQLTEKEKEIDAQTSLADKSQSDMKKLQETLELKALFITKCQRERETLEENERELQNQLNQVKEELDAATISIASWKEKVEELEIELTKKSQSKNEEDGLCLTKYQAEIDSLKLERQNQENVIKSLSNVKAELENQHEMTQNELNQRVDEIKELNNKINGLLRSNQTTPDHDKLREELESLHAEKENIQHTRDELQAKNLELSEKLVIEEKKWKEIEFELRNQLLNIKETIDTQPDESIVSQLQEELNAKESIIIDLQRQLELESTTEKQEESKLTQENQSLKEILNEKLNQLAMLKVPIDIKTMDQLENTMEHEKRSIFQRKQLHTTQMNRIESESTQWMEFVHDTLEKYTQLDELAEIDPIDPIVNPLEEIMVLKSGVNIKAGSVFELPVVCKIGQIIQWTFRIVEIETDINFSLFFQEEQVVPVDRVERLQGTYQVKMDGILKFEWDNSFSWLNPKTLDYHVSIYEKINEKEYEKRKIKEKIEMEIKELKNEILHFEKQENIIQELKLKTKLIHSIQLFIEERMAHREMIIIPKIKLIQEKIKILQNIIDLYIQEQDELIENIASLTMLLEEIKQEENDIETTCHLHEIKMKKIENKKIQLNELEIQFNLI